MRSLLLVAVAFLATIAQAQSTTAEAHEAIRVVQKDGIWWFQDGSGRQFFSLGVNCVGGWYGHAEETPINPARKARIISTLKDWGFNTVGSWSSPSLWDELYVADRIYTDFSEITHDVFDESFWGVRMVERLPNEVRPFLGMKNFIGYFLDDEPAWDPEQIFEFYLSLAKDRPGSQAFIAYLGRYYQGRIGKLNRDWRASYARFETRMQKSKPPTAVPRRWVLRNKVCNGAIYPPHLILPRKGGGEVQEVVNMPRSRSRCRDS